MSVVPCLAWVKRGVAKRIPDKVELEKEELRRIIRETREEIDGLEIEGNDDIDSDTSDEEEEKKDKEEKEEGEEEPKPSSSGLSQEKQTSVPGKRKHEEDLVDDDDDDIVEKYGLEDYDDEEFNFHSGIGNLVYFADNKEDPYINDHDEPDSDDENVMIKPSDNLIAVARTIKDASLLEVYVYDEPDSNLFVHHDIILPSFPLAVEWLDYDPTEETGNYVALGSMNPTIDIWDLDLIDSLEPVFTLGTKQSKKKSKKKGSVLGHSDAVLDLAWNRQSRNVLASASADFTVGLWDLTEAKAVSSIRKHEEKVQCVKWHPAEQQTLLTGSFDSTVRLFDCRDAGYNHKTWSFAGSEIERVVWNHYNPYFFYASTDKGNVYYVDVRYDKPIYTISAHTAAVSGLVLSSSIEHMLVTSSSDQTVKVWDVKDNEPKHIVTKDLKLGEIMCALPCPDSPFVFAFGGQGNMKVWDIRQSAEVKSYFKTGEAFNICLEDHGGNKSNDEEDDDVLIKKTKGLKIKHPKKKGKKKMKDKKDKKKSKDKKKDSSL
ncbi:periodic tryptophan protein 1 homolog [Octopus sinensis]|uniref:Periodic tryptophan protein 1 homolog n=1 Tax=Octopus sinensis TaxID=2607531 RepID=A0A6P7TJZ9_9MOLL|nr:periodic tryptophan protein 1 homolog [Octopus sinensis]